MCDDTKSRSINNRPKEKMSNNSHACYYSIAVNDLEFLVSRVHFELYIIMKKR